MNSKIPETVDISGQIVPKRDYTIRFGTSEKALALAKFELKMKMLENSPIFLQMMEGTSFTIGRLEPKSQKQKADFPLFDPNDETKYRNNGVSQLHAEMFCQIVDGELAICITSLNDVNGTWVFRDGDWIRVPMENEGVFVIRPGEVIRLGLHMFIVNTENQGNEIELILQDIGNPIMNKKVETKKEDNED